MDFSGSPGAHVAHTPPSNYLKNLNSWSNPSLVKLERLKAAQERLDADLTKLITPKGVAKGSHRKMIPVSWSRLSEQNLRVDKWSVCR
ncbi:hypothetical protein ACFFWD_32315, partial [Bradyrhizobium erythrophlei]|uniref:hypothetical protein n=1 Tax=Bradyrhizobium erythrophlei TaxID=1437360 RepID=UPI0035E8D358